MSVKLLTEHHLEFLSLKESCTDSSESTLVKMPHCWKSHAVAHVSSCKFGVCANDQTYHFSHAGCLEKLDVKVYNNMFSRQISKILPIRLRWCECFFSYDCC